jgi:hypothetical protein
MKNPAPTGVPHDEWNLVLAKDYAQRYYLLNAERINRQAREWGAAHPETRRASHKKWTRNNKDRVRGYKQKSYQNNKQKHLAYARRKRAADPNYHLNLLKWRRANAERIRANDRRRNAKRSQAQREYLRAWHRANPEKSRAYRAAARSRIADSQWSEILSVKVTKRRAV